MKRHLNYLVDIEGNEEILEKCIYAINNHTCTLSDEYPNPYVVPTGEQILNSTVIKFFFETRPFQKELYIDFFEKLRKLEIYGFRSISYSLGQQVNELVIKIFDNVKKNKYHIFVPDNVVISSLLTDYEKEILSFVCYLAVCHIKYGASYETITANEYFDVVTKLGSNEVEKLKKYGTGNLPIELTNYKDKSISCKANDVFAKIDIKMTNDEEKTYQKAIQFINNLLKTSFPKSFEIQFSSKNKELLPIKGLPKCGQNYLFAGAVKHPNIHKEILEYIALAKHEHEWYNNLENENCAMPSTFAVFALGLEDNKYFDILIDYLKTVDDEHQSIQEKFTPVFLEKFGINEATVKVYINCILSMQNHKQCKLFNTLFSNEDALNLLLQSKENFANYYFTDEYKKELIEDKNELEEMVEYYWKNVMYTTFGKTENYKKITKQLTDYQLELFNKLA